MEDLTSILGIVIAAGVLVAKAAVRKKGTDAAKENGPADPHGEAWPQIPPFTTSRPAMTTSRPAMTRDEESEPASDTAFGPVARKIAAARKSMQAAEEMPAAARSGAEPQGGSDNHTQAVRDAWLTTQTQVVPKHGPAVVSASPRQTAQTQVVSSAGRQNMQTPRPSVAAQENRHKRAETPEDFDLRKAVIAAEILRHKFDE